MIQVYVDDWRSPFFIRTASDVPAGGRWVFNAPNRFYFLLNVAVGGGWPGPPDATTPSPAQMLVDYVRVYQAAPVPTPDMSAAPIQMNPGGTGSGTITLTHGANRAYLACSGAPAGMECAIDTGNRLNKSVVDFGGGDRHQATITLKRAADTSSPAPGKYSLTVTAYTVSGASASIPVPLVVSD
jgi:hypothetical protein